MSAGTIGTAIEAAVYRRPSDSTMANTAYYLNGDFDLLLAHGLPERLSRLVPEMTLWYVPAAQNDDVVIVDECIPADFVEYLADAGLQVPALTREPVANGKQGHPWGWDRHAVDVLSRAGAVVDHPDLDTVRRVNGRSFSYELATRLGRSVPGARMCRTASEAARSLAAAGPWPRVVKPEHGNAGIGFRLVHNPGQAAAAVRYVTELLDKENGPVFVEPWLERRLDISVRFDVGRDGTFSRPGYAQARVSRSGASFAIVEPDAASGPCVHEEAFREVAVETAAALHKAGYWGPVNIDAMVARMGTSERLFPLLEINARDSMSRIAHGIAGKLGCTCWRQLRTVGGARPGLPRTYEQLRTRLGASAFDPRTGRGILMVTPLTCGLPGRTPHRSIFFMAANTEQELLAIDRALTSLLRSTAR
ncbi:MAG: hypothetical protein GF331_00515 [Chitinivibrionales bacterium]|nr:hypothetical protein [Chitinivibrionales bacterium]